MRLEALRSAFLLRCAALICLCGAALSAHAQQPAAGAQVGLEPTFEWADSADYAQYLFLVRAAGAPIPQYALVSANDPATCADGVTCRLAPGHPAYVLLPPGDFEWATYGYHVQAQAWQPWSPANWSAFRIELPSPALTATWNGDNVQLQWTRVPAAATYSVTLRHEGFAPTSVSLECAADPCTASINVAQIPYGTIRVEMRSCGANGQCSPTPAIAVVTKSCPAAPATPVILSPSPNATLAGFLALQFANVAYAERFRIRVRRNGTPMTEVIDEEVGISTLQCANNTCLRVLPLIVGSYTVRLSAACATDWSGEAERDFVVATAQTVPEILAPLASQATSDYPLIAWRRIAQIDRYEVTATNVATQAKQQAIVTCQVDAICALDALQAQWTPMNGPHDVAVRIAMLEMPSATVRFDPSSAYEPPPAEIISPAEGEHVPWPLELLLLFRADPQAPLVAAEVTGPGGFTAPMEFKRTSPECTLEFETALTLECTISLKLTSTGSHDVYVQTKTPAVAGDMAHRTFLRTNTAAQGDKAIYRIYAQNTQFLPPSPVNGGASSAYGMSDRDRARRLAEYILANNFDVVALSEVFMFPPKEILNQKLGGLYNGVSNIDTQGRVSAGTIAGIVGGYLAGWWVNAAGAGALAGWGMNFSDWFEAANSGLAIYSRFPIVEYGDTADDNSRCTDDLFNELDEDHPAGESGFLINRRVRFRQYCHGAGDDDLSAKGFAAVQLRNTRTGLPLWIMWSHTQAFAAGSSFVGLPDGNYEDSYEARATQIEDNAGPAMNHIMGLTPNFDAFVLGDWNLPQPPSVSAVPRKDPSGNAQTDGWPDFGQLYDAPPAQDNTRNPLLSSLVGGHAPGDDIRLFDQYWAYFDPRNAGRTFNRFTDLWLFNPAGDGGWTFEPGKNPVATCREVGEPCHDRGLRYDTVLASFHAWNWQNNGVTYSGVPRDPQRSPAWDERQSCVLHIRRSLGFALSDHWGTIIEVGPSAPHCSPNTAKADPHKWRVPANAPPQPIGFDDAAGRHQGMFAYGGANEWFYMSDGGSIDVVAVKFSSGFNGLSLEAYDARDLSTRLTAGAEQDPRQMLTETCPDASGHIGRMGHIPKDCATATKRLTYTHDGPFFIRIRPVKDGQVCDNCVGDYEVLFRERFCQEYFDAVPVKARAQGGKPATVGWLGAVDAAKCWFTFDLSMQSAEATPQTLVIEGLHGLNKQFCTEFPGNTGPCDDRYELRIYDSSPPHNDTVPPEKPTVLLVDPPLMLTADADTSTIPTTAAWFAPLGPMVTGVMPKTQKRTFYAELTRIGGTAAQRAGFPWTTNLRTVTYNTVTTTDIQDDLEIEIEVCLPLLGCVLKGIKDPFETEDEVDMSLWIDGQYRMGGRSTLNVDNAGSDAFRFPNTAPGMTKECEEYAYQWCGNANYHVKFARSEIGTTVNYTNATQLSVLERDGFTQSDTVISDMYNCDFTGPAPIASSWAATEFRRAWDELLKGQPANPKMPMRFSDDCPDDDPQFNYFLKATVPALP